MADISIISRLVNGFQRNIDVSQNSLVVGSIKIGTSTPVEITKTIATKLLAIQAAADADGTFDTRYNTKTSLASTSSGQGASLVGIQDSGNYYSGSTVESALQELGAAMGTGNASGISYDNSTSGLTATNVQTAIDEVEGRVDSVEALAATAVQSSEKGAPNGVASLDGSGKVPVSQLPNAIMSFQGMWDASTNTPALANGAGNADEDVGNVYRVSVAGTVDFGAGPISFEVGDYAILNASKIFEKADTTDAVSSVNGMQGAVILDTDDISEGSTNLYFTDERAQDAAANALTDSATIGFSYNDGANEISADVKDNSIDENKLTSSVADQETITGGNGDALIVQQAPKIVKTMIAGESFAADTSFIVRMALDGETVNRVYKADKDASVDNKFFAIGIVRHETGASAGDAVSVTIIGTYDLGANDSSFSSSDIGKPVYLTSAGAFSITAPTSVNEAVMKVGMVQDPTSIIMVGMQLHGIN